MRHIVVLIFIFLYQICSSQNLVITGVVTSTTNEPLPFAAVELFNENDELLTGATSDFDGIYKLFPCDIASGTYILKASYPGYFDTIISDLRISSDFDTISTITAKKLNVRPGFDTIIEIAQTTDNEKRREYIINPILRPKKCKESSRYDCLYYSDSCDIYEIIYIPLTYKVPTKYINKQDKNKIIYKKNSWDEFEECPHRFFCKTHNTEF